MCLTKADIQGETGRYFHSHKTCLGHFYKKKVLRFLDQKHIRAMYHRVEKDDKNFGRIFVHFKF